MIYMEGGAFVGAFLELFRGFFPVDLIGSCCMGVVQLYLGAHV